MPAELARIRLVFAHDGAVHTEVVTVPADRLQQYDRLIDLFREETDITRRLYVDLRKLVMASVIDESDRDPTPLPPT